MAFKLWKQYFVVLFSLWLRATPDQFKTYIQNTTASSKKVGAYLDLRTLWSEKMAWCLQTKSKFIVPKKGYTPHNCSTFWENYDLKIYITLNVNFISIKFLCYRSLSNKNQLNKVKWVWVPTTQPRFKKCPANTWSAILLQ